MNICSRYILSNHLNEIRFISKNYLRTQARFKRSLQKNDTTATTVTVNEHLNNISLKTHKQLQELTEIQSDSNYIKMEEDPNVPVSSIKCSGCGSNLHCQNKSKIGFMPSSKFKSLDKNALIYSLCMRCYYLKTKNKNFNLDSSEFDYDKFIMDKICSKANNKKVHVILLIDLLSLPNSIYAGWSKLFDNSYNHIDVCILGNKFDLLPHTGPLFYKSVNECLMHNCNKKGIAGKH